MSRIKIGWAGRDISTDKPLNMPGQFHMRIIRGILDPLTVTALVVENNDDIAIFVSGDFIDCRSHILDDLRAMGYTGLLEADGGVSMSNVALLREHGLDVAVMGTAMLGSATPEKDMEAIHAL